MLKIGLVGCGTIGTRLAQSIEQQFSSQAQLVAVYDHHQGNIGALCKTLKSQPVLMPLAELIDQSDLVVEAASVAASSEIVPQALEANRSVLVLSVGGLLADQRWQSLSKTSQGHIYVPSGALAGLDAISAMAQGKLVSVQLVTRKPPRSLAGTEYIERQKIVLEGLQKPLCVFEGTPLEAIQSFPKNTNVAAALALAVQGKGITPQIRVIADPNTQLNTHEVTVEADCGRLSVKVENNPSSNPKTSELAVRSAVATLARILSSVRIGT